MKMDKETWVKHQFWFLLGGFALVWLIALLTLKISAAGPIAEKRENFKKAKDRISGAQSKGPKNKSFLTPWNQYGAVFKKHKDTIWGEAWDKQKDMYTWPFSSSARLDLHAKYPTDELPAEERSEYKNTLYLPQFDELSQMFNFVNPTTEKPPVQFAGGVEAIIPPVQWQQIPTTEECWLAQEDFWVQRELLRLVRDVLENVGRFEEVKVKDWNKEPLPATFPKEDAKKIIGRHRYRSPHWELDLIVMKDGQNRFISPYSTIKNVHFSGRTLALSFKNTRPLLFLLKQGNSSLLLRVQGEPLAPGAVTSISPNKTRPPQTTGAISLEKPFEVQEIFNRGNSPVRRIDALRVPMQSHRTAITALKSNPAITPASSGDAAGGTSPEAAGGAAMAGGAEPMPGGPPGGPGGPGGMADPGMGMKGGLGGIGDGTGQGAVVNPTPNNSLERNRYEHVTPQARHLPLGMLLIVDQAHIPDVLLAVANSRLRIQTTQTEWHHVRGIYADDEEETGAEGDTAGVPGALTRGARTGIGARSLPGMGARGLALPGASRVPGYRARRGMSKSAGPGLPGGPAGLPGARVRPPRGGISTTPGGVVGPGMTDANGVQEEDDPNLVELSVSGIATLSERFPPKQPAQPADGSAPAAGAAEGAAPAPGAPAAPAAPPAAPGAAPAPAAPAPGGAPAPAAPTAPAAPANGTKP